MQNRIEWTGDLPVCRQQRRIWRLQTVLIALAIGLFCTAYSEPAETPREHITRLIREASGPQPITQNRVQQNTAFDRAFRSVYHDLILANRTYTAAVKRIDSKSIRQLGTPGSFVDQAGASFALDQLHATYALEIQHEQRVGQIHARLRRILEAATTSPVIKADLLRIYQELIATSSLERQRCIAAEKSWIDAMDDLYRYANTHSDDVHFLGGMISISDPIIRQEFNQRIIAEESQRQELLKRNAEYGQMQARVFQAFAIDPKSIGLE